MSPSRFAGRRRNLSLNRTPPGDRKSKGGLREQAAFMRAPRRAASPVRGPAANTSAERTPAGREKKKRRSAREEEARAPRAQPRGRGGALHAARLRRGDHESEEPTSNLRSPM